MNKQLLTGLTIVGVAASAGAAYEGVSAIHSASAESAPTSSAPVQPVSRTIVYQVGEAGQEINRLVHGGFEHVANGPFQRGVRSAECGTDFDFQDVRAITTAIAIRATDENVAEKLHLNLLEPCAATFFALADAGVEAEGAGIQAALPGHFGLREDFADVIERADIDGWIRTWGFAQSRLVHEDNLAERFVAGDAFCVLRDVCW